MFSIPHRIEKLQSFSGAQRPRRLNDFGQRGQWHRSGLAIHPLLDTPCLDPHGSLNLGIVHRLD
jgi:hypothetical protein